MVDTLDPALLLNVCLDWKDALGVSGLHGDLAFHDLLDQAPGYAQAYDSWHAPLPGPGRQFTLTLRYGGGWK